MVYVWLILFFLLVPGSWCFNLLGLPGNWLILLTAAAWAAIGPADYRFTWIVVMVLFAMAILGELIEFGASVFGTRKLGGTKRGATLAVVGSMVGATLGAIFGIPFPIPLVGVLIGSVLFAATGALIGATIGERWVGKPIKESARIGGAAFAGRLLGTLGKLALGSAMAGLSIVAPFLF